MLPVPDGLYALLAGEGYGPDLFNPRQHECGELVEEYALHSAIQVVGALGIVGALQAPRAVSELIGFAGLAPSFEAPLAWLLRLLAYWDVAAWDHGEEAQRFHLRSSLPADARQRLRARCSELDPDCLPNLNLFDAAAAVYPRVARGEVKAEQALLGRADLWSAYFSNHNSIYALCNRVTARCAASRLPPSAARVLEVGAGLGSATEALLDALSNSRGTDGLERYEVTEPISFFRNKSARLLAVSHPHSPLAFAAFDINKEWSAQRHGPPPHLVVGCNVFHLARDLQGTLRQVASTLEVGGWLVAGECVRPFAHQTVGAEFPLELLADYRDGHGFLTPEQWLAAFEHAGFVDVSITPDLRRVRALHPRFISAAIAGRRAA